MSLVIAVACEADADFRATSTLIDRTLLENVSWVEQELLTHLRQFVAENPPYEWTRIQSVPAAILSKKLRVTPGKFRGEPGAPDALLARKTIVLLNSLNPQPNLLIVVRDTDNEPGRQIGWQQARTEYHGKPPLILGMAIIKRENWILAGFRSRSTEEQERLKSERQTLGYDPILHPDQPNSHERGSKHCPKRVLEHLVGTAGVERELECLRDTPLAELQARGESVGLSQFLIEIRTIMCPLLGASRKS